MRFESPGMEAEPIGSCFQIAKNKCGLDEHESSRPRPPTKPSQRDGGNGSVLAPHRPNQQKSSNRKPRPDSTTVRKRPELHKHLVASREPRP
jgi:hypothetical protein